MTHSCLDCLNSIPPQQIDECANCLAEKQPNLFPTHIITERDEINIEV